MRKVLYILGELADTDLQWIVDAGKIRSLTANTEIVSEGGVNDTLFIVVEGDLSVVKGGVQLASLSTGEVIGEMSLLDSRPPSATVTSTKASLVWAVPQSTLRKKLVDDVHFAARFYRALSIFLANRLGRIGLQVGANAAATPLDENEGELSPELLENIGIAGARFDWFLQRIRGSVNTE
jgi:CRP/FNR family cyclic AMP-dependent transcriptional regulator